MNTEIIISKQCSGLQGQPHLEPVEDEAEEIDRTLDTSEGGEDYWSHKYDVAETQQTQSPGGPHVSAVQLSPGLGKTKITIFSSLPFSSNQA